MHAGTDAIPPIDLQPLTHRFDEPVYLTHTSEYPSRLYIVEKSGSIRTLNKEDKDSPPDLVLDIEDQVATGYEMGLLSMVFHPNFGENRRIFVNYTSTTVVPSGTHTVISEWKMNESGTRVLPDSEKIIMTIKQPYNNHNGGQIAFGPDGDLYIGTGDGGSANDPGNHAQNLNSLLGKMLRIDVDDPPSGKNYRIPSDNPWTNTSDAQGEIWAYGLRNPWRFSFDPETHHLWAGDVGQNDREEVNIIEKGQNYGWRIYEGTILNPNLDVSPPEDQSFTEPIWEYETYEQGRSVVGGFVYRGDAIPELQGVYLFADYWSGKIWGLRYHDDAGTKSVRLLKNLPDKLSSFGRGPTGALYILSLEGRIWQITKEDA